MSCKGEEALTQVCGRSPLQRTEEQNRPCRFCHLSVLYTKLKAERGAETKIRNSEVEIKMFMVITGQLISLH